MCHTQPTTALSRITGPSSYATRVCRGRDPLNRNTYVWVQQFHVLTHPVVPVLAMARSKIGVVELMRVNQEFLPIGYTDLVENVGQMMTDGTVGNTESVGDLFVREPLTD